MGAPAGGHWTCRLHHMWIPGGTVDEHQALESLLAESTLFRTAVAFLVPSTIDDRRIIKLSCAKSFNSSPSQPDILRCSPNMCQAANRQAVHHITRVLAAQVTFLTEQLTKLPLGTAGVKLSQAPQSRALFHACHCALVDFHVACRISELPCGI